MKKTVKPVVVAVAEGLKKVFEATAKHTGKQLHERFHAMLENNIEESKYDDGTFDKSAFVNGAIKHRLIDFHLAELFETGKIQYLHADNSHDRPCVFTMKDGSVVLCLPHGDFRYEDFREVYDQLMIEK
jgi:hypothetical protein